jgi:sortase A
VTLVREDEALDQIEPEVQTVPEARSAAVSHHWRRWAAIAALGALATLLTLALFTGPVERIWYRNRQQQLAADMSAQRVGVAPGQALAVLQVPRLGVNVVVVEGDNPERLRGGPGHRVGTAKPGARGNSVIVGHRSAWGGPFAPLSRVRRGDLIAIQTRAGRAGVKKTIVYTVRGIARVGGSDTRLLRPSREHRLTLVTGRGGRFSDDRLVISAVSGGRVAGSPNVRAVRAETPGQSVIFNLVALMALVAFALAAGAAVYLRGRSGRGARLVVVLPLIAAGTLCLLLDLDLLLPPLN